MILDIIGQLKGPQSGTSLRNRLTSLFGMALEVPQKAETVTEMMIFPIIQDQLSHALELNLLFFSNENKYCTLSLKSSTFL